MADGARGATRKRPAGAKLPPVPPALPPERELASELEELREFLGDGCIRKRKLPTADEQ